MAYQLHEREWGDIHRHSRQGGGGLYHPPEDTKKYQSPSQEVDEGKGRTRKGQVPQLGPTQLHRTNTPHPSTPPYPSHRQAASMFTPKQTNRSHDVSPAGPSEAPHVQEKGFDTSKRPTLATAQCPDLLAGPSSFLNPLGANMSPSSAHETHQLRYIVPTGPTLQDNVIFPELRRQHKVKQLRGVPEVRKSILAILKTSWLNVLLVFIPLSWFCHFLGINNTLVFIFSSLAFLPLAKLLDFATEELSLRLGQTLAGLLNATLGNAVELTVAIIALVKCELVIIQTSLIGSILSNLLLVLGMCFFAGGTRSPEQGFGKRSTQLNSFLLTLSAITVLLPAAFQPITDGVNPLTEETHEILTTSHWHGAPILLLFISLCSVVFHHKSDRANVQNPASSTPRPHNVDEGSMEEEKAKPQMSSQMAIALFAVVTVVVAITAEILVDSIDGLTESGHINKEYAGLILLLPIVGNAASKMSRPP
ncbi:hypothetical protein EDB85DRAFT_1313648 [Lactarius pseudohatsudake]|nr:hypothetical protein EDB85DRAFT_1313648 [Lactarius pseudohatsudake]